MDEQTIKALQFLIPAAGASIAGGGVGLGSFSEAYTRGRALAEEQAARERAYRAREAEIAYQHEQDRLAREDTQRGQWLKVMDQMPALKSRAMQTALARGAMTPELMVPHAQGELRTTMDALRKAIPGANLLDQSVFDAFGAITPEEARTYLAGQVLPEYERLVAGLDQPALERMRQSPVPIGKWQLPFAELERLAGRTGDPAPKQYAPGSFEQYMVAKFGNGPYTADQITEGRKVYQQADDRPRVTVNVPPAPTVVPGLGIENVPPEKRAAVTALIEGRTDIGSYSIRSRPGGGPSERSEMMSYALAADPNWTPLRYTTRKAFMDPNSKTSLNMRSLNTAVAHAQKLQEVGKALQNRDYRAVNAFVNWVKNQTGNPAVVNFDTAMVALSGESANVFKNSGGTDQEIAKWHSAFSAAQAPAQISGALETLGELLRGRLSAIQWEYQRAFGADQMFPILSPEARKGLTGLGIDYSTLDPGGKDAGQGSSEATRGKRADLKARLGRGG